MTDRAGADKFFQVRTRSTKPTRHTSVLAWVVPFLLVAALPFFRTPAYWHNGYYDPEYAYLMNSVVVLQGGIPQHRDHPGSSIQLLGALVLRASHPLLSTTQMTEQVVRDPEHELRRIGTALWLLCAVLIGLAGRLAMGTFGRPWLVPVYQLLPFATPHTWYYVGRVTPDMLVLSLGLVLMPLLARRQETASPYLAGMVLGAAVPTKLVAAPLALLIAIAFKDRPKALLKVALGSVVAGVIAALPILNKQSAAYISQWIWRLATHSGRYGTGDQSVLPGFSAVSNLVPFLLQYWVILPSLALGILAWIRKHKSRSASPTHDPALFLGAILTILLQLLLVAKHPGARYFFPLLGASAWLLVFSFSLFFSKHESASRALAAAVAAASLLAASYSFSETRFSGVSRELTELGEAAAREHCRMLYDYPTSSEPMALVFGDGMAGLPVTKLVKARFPEFLMLLDQVYDAARAPVPIDRLRGQGAPLCFQTYQGPASLSRILPNAKTTPLTSTMASEVLYRVEFR